MRSVVSYDDIAAPEDSAPTQLGLSPSTNQPPAKKRKTNQKAPQKRTPQYVQHWDDPGSGAEAMSYDDPADVQEDEYAEVEEEESRELTHEELWDDSALIDAWNSANAEYEAFHGTDKKWKNEPVKKSPLWYNVPPSPSKLRKGKAVARSSDIITQTGPLDGESQEQNSTPLNFDTYVPTHDPSLASAIPHPPSVSALDYSKSHLSDPSGLTVDQDEAFSRALSAMYWAGYWTAVYHGQRQASQLDQEAEDEDSGVDGTNDDLVSAQR